MEINKKRNIRNQINMKQPAYKRGPYKVKKPPMVQCNIRMHEHEKPLVKQFLKQLRENGSNA